MSVLNGTLVRLKIGVPAIAPATGIVFMKIAREMSAKFSISVKDIDTTSKDNGGWEESIPGLMSGSISGELLVDYADKAGYVGYKTLLAMVLGRQLQTFQLGTDTSTDPNEQFTGFFTKFDKDASMEAAIKVSFDLKVTTQPTPVV